MTTRFALRGGPPGLLLALAAAALAGCAAAPSALTVPTSVAPPLRPAYVERAATGSLFRADAPVATLFAAERRPRAVGDTLKIRIDESASATQNLATDTRRENQVATKGPGSDSETVRGALKTLLNLDASASGRDAYQGSGTAENRHRFSGRIVASVVNVLPNGHLVVAGERSLAFNEGTTTLRFSGVVDPEDIQAGNVVASGDVAGARLELVGQGGVADAAARSWMQRVLTKGLTVW